jgi:aldehyde dehydrogenase (NAD+)
MASALDVHLAVKAARSAISASILTDRIALLMRVLGVFMRRYGEMGEAITTEMGAPHNLSQRSQAGTGPGHIKATLAAALALARGLLLQKAVARGGCAALVSG